MEPKKHIAIIGAGIGGMSAAYDLAKAGQQVTFLRLLIMWVVWQQASKNLIGIGLWSVSTITGSIPMNICWA